MNIKRSFAIVLMAALLCLLAGSALAAVPTTLFVGGVNALTNPNGNGWNYADGVLTLTNASITNTEFLTVGSIQVYPGIYFGGGDLTIELIGNNTIEFAPSKNLFSYGICSMDTNLTLKFVGNGSLSIGFTENGTYSIIGCSLFTNSLNNTAHVIVGDANSAPVIMINTPDVDNDSDITTYSNCGISTGHITLNNGILSISAGNVDGLSQDRYGISSKHVPVLNGGTLIVEGAVRATSFDSRITPESWMWRASADAEWTVGVPGDSNDEPIYQYNGGVGKHRLVTLL